MAQEAHDLLEEQTRAVEQARHELQDLITIGLAKSRRRQGKITKLNQEKNRLHAEWKRTSERSHLHLYVKAVEGEGHFVPSKILSQQAKLSQCLHLMEVFMRQKTLIEKQNRKYAELIAREAAEQEDERSEVTLDSMNELCEVDSEIRDLKEEMKDLGMSIDSIKEECEEDQESLQESDKSSSKEEKEEPTETRHWWWPIQHSDEKQKPPLSGCEDSTGSDESSSLMDLLWMPAKFKPADSPLPVGSQHTISDKSDASPTNAKPVSKQWWPAKTEEKPILDGSTQWWPAKTAEKPILDGSTHSDSSDKSDDSFVSYEGKPVARQWWPSKVEKPAEPDPVESEEGIDQQQQHWWEGFYR